LVVEDQDLHLLAQVEVDQIQFLQTLLHQLLQQEEEVEHLIVQ
tara:strand:- start:295 stop:423 length:129 start_codon:yes stop_codon:yes gene_type:complete